MGIIVNNIKPIRIIFNGVEATLYHNGIKIWPEGSDPYNPLNLPPNTVRVRTGNGSAPNKGGSTTYATATLVPGTTDVYDVYKSGTDFNSLLYGSDNVIEVLGANTTGITNMNSMFYDCSLTSVALFDTSSVTNMGSMFYDCNSLTSIPLFNTSSVEIMDYMFYSCVNVQSGALALYQQASTQAIPPFSYGNCFSNCGVSTVTGIDELVQIPLSWGGLGA